MIYFTSDTHFWHKQIIPYCNRPVPGIQSGQEHWGTNVELMNEWLIQRWNEKVKKDDEIYHLGDFAFAGKTKTDTILSRLNGRKHLIRGNHDGSTTAKSEYWESVEKYRFIHVPLKYEDNNGDVQSYNQPIALFHFPILSWDGMAHGSWHLHGHCHGSLSDSGGLRLDMGVDCWYYAPVSVEEIQNEMALRTVSFVDHHDRRENNPRFAHLLHMKKK